MEKNSFFDSKLSMVNGYIKPKDINLLVNGMSILAIGDILNQNGIVDDGDKTTYVQKISDVTPTNNIYYIVANFIVRQVTDYNEKEYTFNRALPSPSTDYETITVSQQVKYVSNDVIANRIYLVCRMEFVTSTETYYTEKVFHAWNKPDFEFKLELPIFTMDWDIVEDDHIKNGDLKIIFELRTL